MKTILSLMFLMLTLALGAHAQDPITIHNGCNFAGEETESEYYYFDASDEGSKIVKQILDAAGSLSYNSFIAKESNVQNALATVEGGQRYVFYSVPFLEKFKGDAKTKWAAYTVLAHEIGHHLNGHNFAEKDPQKRKKMELEADKFAGAVCRTLNATLDQALAGIESIPLEGETATHPPKSARVAAVANGWKKQDEILKGQPVKNTDEMEYAVESLSGKISQQYQGVELILLSAKTIQTGYRYPSQDEAIPHTIFKFLVHNRTDSVVTYSIYRDYGVVSKTSIVQLGDYDEAEVVIIEKNSAYNSANQVSKQIAEEATSNCEVVFYKITQTSLIPELRVTISVAGADGKNPKKKTLVFRNITLPYEAKK